MNNKASELIQQGDVLVFTNHEKLPAEAQEVQPIKGRLILAEGEATGHSHSISLMDYPSTRLFEHEGNKFLECLEQVEVVHEEHHKVVIPKGLHRIGIVVEVDPFADEIRKVKD